MIGVPADCLRTTLPRARIGVGSSARVRRGAVVRTSDASRLLAHSTIALSVHGPAGVLDLVVPAGATAVDVAREYAKQGRRTRWHPAAADRPSASGLNAAVAAGRGRASSSGDVLVATTRRAAAARVTHPPDRGYPRPPRRSPPPGSRSPAVVAALAAWYIRRPRGPDIDYCRLTVASVGCCSPPRVLPVGRFTPPPGAAPAFAAAAAFAALHEPGILTCSRASSEPPCSRLPSRRHRPAPCRGRRRRGGARCGSSRPRPSPGARPWAMLGWWMPGSPGRCWSSSR